MKIGIVGCGLIGQKRARSALAQGHEVTLVADLDDGRAKALASSSGATVAARWQDVVAAEIDAVVVASQQRVADAFFQQHLIPKKIDIANAVWRGPGTLP